MYIDQIVQRIIEHGFLLNYLNGYDYFLDKVNKVTNLRETEEMQRAQPLNIKQIMGFFYIYLSGMSAGILVFLTELIWFNRKRIEKCVKKF